MKKIEGSPKSLKQLLQNTKYSIHYYQREYMWQRKQVEELIDDLTSEFLESYKQGDERPDVKNYDAYFMGSIVLAGRVNAIIDGQQRLVTIALLLLKLGLDKDISLLDEKFGDSDAQRYIKYNKFLITNFCSRN